MGYRALFFESTIATAPLTILLENILAINVHAKAALCVHVFFPFPVFGCCSLSKSVYSLISSLCVYVFVVFLMFRCCSLSQAYIHSYMDAGEREGCDG